MEAASIAHAAATARPRPPRPAGGQPLLARRAADARHAAFHHLGDHGLRGVLHGLLLHPRGRRAPRWPAEGTELPKLIAGVNTAILLSSSITMHWALESAKSDNRFGAEGRHPHDLPARRDVPLHPDQRVRPHRLRAAGPRAGHDLLRAHRPARRARLRRPDAARDGRRPRLHAVTSPPRSTAASRCRGSTGTSST